MSDVDLDALLGGSGDETGEETPPAGDNSSIKAIRDAQKLAVKEAKEARKKAQELEAELNVFRNEKKQAQIKTAFEGVDPVYAELFAVKHEGDVTTEAVQAFLKERGVEVKAAEENSTEEVTEQPAPTGYAPVVGVAEATEPPARKQYTPAEAWALTGGDRVKIERMKAAGQIVLNRGDERPDETRW